MLRSVAPRPEAAAEATFERSLAELVRLIADHVPDAARVSDMAASNASLQQRLAIQQTLHGRDQLPEVLFDGLLRAAVHDQDPSANRQFVEPALAACGRRRVQEALLAYLQTGTDLERAGAVRAWYWTQVPLVYKLAEILENEDAAPTAESKAEYDAYADLRARFSEAALREFVATGNPDVRRSILPVLSLDPADHPQRLHRLVSEAAHLARTRSDDD